LTVYVDDMFRHPIGRYRRMKMSHMIADSAAELDAMADTIGVARRWRRDGHYDICLAKRALAVARGAREITMRQCALMVAARRDSGVLPTPERASAKWATRAFKSKADIKQR
jgi:hypothetical protein